MAFTDLPIKKQDEIKRKILERLYVLSEMGLSMYDMMGRVLQEYHIPYRCVPKHSTVKKWLAEYDKSEYHRRALRTLQVWRNNKILKGILPKAIGGDKKAIELVLKIEKHEAELYALKELDAGLKSMPPGVKVEMFFPFDVGTYPASKHVDVENLKRVNPGEVDAGEKAE